MKLGDIVKQYRKSENLTMQEFAERAELSKGYVSMLEKGQHPQSKRKLIPSLETYQKLAAAMNIPVDYLFSAVDDDSLVHFGSKDSENDSALILSAEEESLLSSFRELNEEGRDKVLSYVEDLNRAGIYKRDSKTGLVQDS